MKYILAAFIAAATFAFTAVSCDDEDEKSFLSEVQVNSSYVALPGDGGSQTIQVSAKGAWQITNIPEWLTVSPASGSGDASVTFSAAKAASTNEATVLLVCEGKTQRINVLQMTEKVDLPISTCAQVLAGLDGTAFRVSGVITKIAESATYGNMYINDGTGEVYIYGTKYNGNTKQGAIEKLGLSVGDEVTVEGPKTTYGGTVELVDVDVISYNKSLIKCDSTDVDVLPLEGGVLTAYITCKGNGVSVDIPEDAQEWLSVIGVNSKTVKFRAAANLGGDRSTTVVIKTTDGKKDYTSQLAIAQKGAIIECSLADFLAAEVGDTQYRVTGILTGVKSASYGNCYIRDFSGEIYVYGVGAKGDFEALGLKEGDIVTLVGKRGEYKGDPQMVNAICEAVKSTTPISIAEFNNLPDDTNAYYMISGTIVEATADGTKNDVTQYGNFNLKDEAGDEVYIYGVYTGWGGKKGQFGELDLTWGDKLTIVAYKTSYKGLIEGVGYYFSSEKAE